MEQTTPARKPLAEQVIVITGASSGIGLATAQLAAHAGAKVLLSSRDETDLRSAVDGIRAAGDSASFAVADVADYYALERVAEQAEREYGTIDTWVNNAGASIFGTVVDVPLAAAQRLFQTNYFGVVHGSLVAVRHMRERGGTLINLGSALSDTPIPLQVHYSASKHAVKGFTDGLRMELEKDGVPITVTLIQPASINTPYAEHAENYMGVEPALVAPVYAPEVVARAILACAERPRRDVRVGGGAEAFKLLEEVAPRIGDKVKEATQVEGQQSDAPAKRDGILFHPRPGDGRVNGSLYTGHVMQTSAYTAARLNPRTTLLLAAAAGAGILLATRERD
ncbi:MAG: SDR family oxidoreductase [Candidatus Eremiobacteraeota bacterium]|nr:SDR family oxidoreductase [Candidatus Eremiobacteraeota bacterium]